MTDPTRDLRQARLATLAASLLAALFWAFFNVSKHQPSLAAVNVFAEDPYDAVGSFGVQLAGLAALLSLLRSFRPAPQGFIPARLALVLRSNLVLLIAVAVTLLADGVALIRYADQWTASIAGWRLAGLAGALMALNLLAGWPVLALGRRLGLASGRRSWQGVAVVCVTGVAVLGFYPSAWRQSVPGALFAALLGMVVLFVCTYALAILIFPPTGEPAGDLMDDLAGFYVSAKAHAPAAWGLFSRLERLAEFFWAQALIRALDPRRHPWRLAALAAAGMGSALLMAEVVGEGVPRLNLILVVAAVFITIEGAGVLLGYLLFRQYLGLFRRQPTGQTGNS